MTRLSRAVLLVLGASAAGAFVTAGGCFYPSYTFDEVDGGGGAGAEGSTTTTGTTSTTTGSSTTSTSSAGGGGAGGGTGGEDCLNGTDDDMDGLADCADPDCGAGYSCVDPIPLGWGAYGYVALAQSVPGAEPQCPGPFPDQGFLLGATPIAPDATCTACTCDAPTGQTCMPSDQDAAKGGVQAVLVSTQACGMALSCTGAESVPQGWAGNCGGGSFWQGSHQAACTAMPCASSNCNKSVKAGAPVVSGGVCAPKGGAANVPPVTWAVSAKGCAGGRTGTGCGGSQTCQAKPTAGFEATLCVAQAGDSACPAPFTVKFLFDDPAQTMDDRGCTPCSCSAPSGGACDLSVDVWSDAGCATTKVATITGPSYCVDLVNNPDVSAISATTTMAPTGSTCSAIPGGGVPTGSVAAAGPTTVCCLP